MKKKINRMIRPVLFAASALLLGGCAFFPKEEELVKTPIIEAYQQEEFRMAEVKRGVLKHYETMDAIVQTVGEKSLSFPFDNMAYEGIYVKTGDTVKKDQLLAKINPGRLKSQVGDSSQLELRAPFDGVVVYARELEPGEKSVSRQIVLILNESDTFVVSVFTPYWKMFETGKNYMFHYAGEDYQITAVDPEDVGLEPITRPEAEGEPSRLYFTVHAPGLLLQSSQTGTVTILLEEKEDALYIPAHAINLINDEQIVYVEDANGIRTTKKVKTGMEANDNVEILEGLSEGDKVILE